MITPAGWMAGRLAFFYVAIFAAIGVFLPYWPVWLASRGLDSGAIGWVIGVSFWPRLITNVAIPLMADRLGRHRAAMLGLSALTLLGLALFTLADRLWLFLALSLVTGASWAAILPLGEAACLQQAHRHGLQFGRVRLWGSLAFIVMSVAAGYGLERHGPDLIMTLILATIALTLAAAWLMPASEARPGPRQRLGLAPLWRDRPLLQLMLASALLQGSHAVYYGFGTLHWRAAGHSDLTIGWLWAEGVIAEIVLFVWGSRLADAITPRRLLILAGLLTMLRWSVTGVTTGLPWLVLAQALHAASFGLSYLATMHYLRDHAPPALQASAQGIYTGLGLAPLFGLLTPLGGWLYGAAGGHAFLAMAGLAGLGTALAWTIPRAALARAG